VRERVFAEAASGKRFAHRPEWQACLAHLCAGETLAVVELSRLGRNTGDLGRLLDDLDERGIGLQILNLGIDTTNPAGRLIFTIVGAVAAMERDLLIERTQSGLELRQMTMAQIAKALGSSPATVYRYLEVDGP
jgi:DNA invertase Pin-like site-specific DNA recombinase